MRDLVVITADADMEAVMRAVLKRPQALGIRDIAFEVRRHDGRDAGVFQNRPEVTRTLKSDFDRLLMLWNHHGSGQEHKLSPEASAEDVQRRLDGVTWRDRSNALALCPELEEWLWHSPNAIGKWLGVPDSQLSIWQEEFANQTGQTLKAIKRDSPKEMFQFICRKHRKRLPRIQDYGQIAEVASLAAWQSSPTFKSMTEQLKTWFPLTTTA